MREPDLEQLYERLERPIYNVVYRWLWNADEAQEIVQEAFVRLWRMRRRVDMSRVEALVYRIALNLARSRARSRRIWRWVSLDALRGAASTSGDPEGNLAMRQDRLQLRRAIEQLPADLRNAVLLCEFSEMSYGQIGELLGVPAGTVGSRRNRAIRRLTKMMTEGSGSDERPVERPV